MNSKKIMTKTCAALFIAALTLVFFSIKFSMLKKSDYPNGLDGFYYALQAESFVVNLEFENPDIECGYYISGFISGVIGDSVTGVKIWAALSSALLSLSVFTLLYVLLEKFPGRFFFSLTGMLFSGVSVCVTIMSINYINNQTGLFFLLFYAASLISCFREKETRFDFWANIIIAVAMLVMSVLSHRTSAVYAVVMTVLYICSKILSGKLSGKNAFSVIALVFVLCFAVIVIIVGQSKRFSHSFAFPSFAFLHKNLISCIGEKGVSGSVEITFCYLFAWLMAAALILIEKKVRVEYFFVPVIFFPFWNYDSDMGFRMAVNGLAAGIPLLFYFAARLVGFIKAADGIKVFLSAALAPVFFIMIFFSSGAYNPKFDPPFEYYKSIAEKIDLPSDSLLIAHQGLNHVYTYYNNLRDSMNWLPDYEIEEDKVWRLAYGANAERIREVVEEYEKNLQEQEEPVEDAAEENKDEAPGETKEVKEPADPFEGLEQIDWNYVLLKESLWQEYLIAEDTDIAGTFDNWYNPSEVRPDYIRKSERNTQ